MTVRMMTHVRQAAFPLMPKSYVVFFLGILVHELQLRHRIHHCLMLTCGTGFICTAAGQ